MVGDVNRDNELDENETIYRDVIYKLSENELKFLQDNKDLEEKIFNFCVSNNFSKESKIFVIEVIKTKKVNPDSEFDFEERLIYLPEKDYTYWMTPPEKLIFETLNNFQKIQYLKSAFQAKKYTQMYYKSTYKNGNGDAFRHAFWNALSAIRIGKKAHQKIN